MFLPGGGGAANQVLFTLVLRAAAAIGLALKAARVDAGMEARRMRWASMMGAMWFAEPVEMVFG